MADAQTYGVGVTISSTEMVYGNRSSKNKQLL